MPPQIFTQTALKLSRNNISANATVTATASSGISVATKKSTVDSSVLSHKKTALGTTTIEAKPQLKNLIGDSTKLVPTQLRVKKVAKTFRMSSSMSGLKSMTVGVAMGRWLMRLCVQTSLPMTGCATDRRASAARTTRMTSSSRRWRGCCSAPLCIWGRANTRLRDVIICNKVGSLLFCLAGFCYGRLENLSSIHRSIIINAKNFLLITCGFLIFSNTIL